jgi:hypothetical protein
MIHATSRENRDQADAISRAASSRLAFFGEATDAGPVSDEAARD